MRCAKMGAFMSGTSTLRKLDRKSGPAVLRVALLFHASKVYDREVLAGIGDYVKQTRDRKSVV